MHKALSLAPSCSRRACSPVFLVPFPASFSSLTISALSPTQPPYFIEASTPSSTGSSERSKQCVSLARECFCQDVSQNLYRWGREEVRRRHPGRGGEEQPRVRGWDGRVGDVAEARAVFEKGEPRHISLQTNNFWIFISCFSLPACVPVSKANATLTTRQTFGAVSYVHCLADCPIHFVATSSFLLHFGRNLNRWNIKSL